ncbi:shugoshin C terminus-like protein [Elsinoe australis]|uniref:Shugoshin C terminus-like protein n=1 Tax=Elsinoe australis TaxID=40998 RepID=A0A4U7B4X1_9PEZI|nr:shugoshin C terminus-like protein [Elsinoe australis]
MNCINLIVFLALRGQTWQQGPLTSREEVRSRSSTLPIPVQAQPDRPVETIEPEKLPPKTPSADLFSPTPEPSSVTSTQPHDAATSANLEGLDGTARPSRRARAAVSYAEPSF